MKQTNETEQTIKALTIIAKAQEQCAEVKLTIGTTIEGHVEHGGIYIIDCPASVIMALTEAGAVLEMNDGKLSIAYWRD